jgi:hypothetical protein
MSKRAAASVQLVASDFFDEIGDGLLVAFIVVALLCGVLVCAVYIGAERLQARGILGPLVLGAIAARVLIDLCF